jgi:hypothetical protein
MGHRMVLAVWVCAACLTGNAWAVTVETGPPTAAEKKLCRAVEKADPFFHCGDRVKRHYEIAPDTGAKLPVLVEFVYEKDGPLYFGEYISYAASVDPLTSVVTYTFDAGTALRGRGTAMTTGKGVIVVRETCGTSGCSVEVLRDGKRLYGGQK